MDECILTEEQRNIILGKLVVDGAPPTVRELLTLLFPNQELDARSKEGRAIREFIATEGLEYTSSRTWKPTKVIVLTEDQKIFIANNCAHMMPLEMARILFKNEALTNLDVETREIQKYIKELPANIKSLPETQKKEINIEDYRPPKTEDQTIARINRYVTSADYHKDQLSEKHKKEIKKLMQYLHIHRFLTEIQKYETLAERELFESEYIRGTFNKSDLTQEQLDQYIMYAGLVVNGTRIDATKKRLEEIEQACLEQRSTVPQGLADRINDLSGRYDQCIDAQNKILKSLEGERKERLKNNNQVKETVADILAYFQSEEKRKHLDKLRMERRAKLKEEINRIKSMEDIKAEMFGVTEEELLS